MALREDQIQRYSRQILLREVGGKGQQRLLEHGVEVEGRSEALDVAVAYLAASGTPLVDLGSSPRLGFLDGAALESFAPDAKTDAPVRGWLGPSARAASIEVSRFRVGVADDGLVAAPAGVAWPVAPASDVSRLPVGAGEEGIFAAPMGVPGPANDVSRLRHPIASEGTVAAPARLTPPEPDLRVRGKVDPVTLGALAALAVQRFALGLETTVRSLGFVDGRWEPRD